jgi:hypothetical protein
MEECLCERGFNRAYPVACQNGVSVVLMKYDCIIHSY